VEYWRVATRPPATVWGETRGELLSPDLMGAQTSSLRGDRRCDWRMSGRQICHGKWGGGEGSSNGGLVIRSRLELGEIFVGFWPCLESAAAPSEFQITLICCSNLFNIRDERPKTVQVGAKRRCEPF
jgi:hypothetical protein